MVIKLLIDIGIPLLWGRVPHEWPRNRWTGFDISLEDIGVPMVIHQLEKHFYEQMLLDMKEEVRPRNLIPLPGLIPSGNIAIMDLETPLVEEDPSNTSDGDDFLKKAARRGRCYRQQSFSWLGSYPIGRLLVTAFCARPMIIKIKGLIERSGDHWHDEQTVRNFKGNASRFLGSREWPMIVAAQNQLEENTSRLLEEVSLYLH